MVDKLGLILVSALAIASVALDANSASAARMFATYVGPLGASRHSFFEIDPGTGEARLVAGLPDRVWGDLSGREGADQSVYAVSSVYGSDPSSTLSTIDIESGEVSDLFTWRASDFGLAETIALEFTGLDISASASDIATISVVGLDLVTPVPVDSFLFDFDLNTGAYSTPRVISGNATSPRDLTSNGAGDFFGLGAVPADFSAVNLLSVDRDTAALTAIGRTAACNCRAIDFDPATGNLFGIDIFGNLRVLSPESADEIEFIGPTGLGFQGEPASATGVAFVTPEPTTSILVGLGLAALAGGRRRGTASHAA